MPEEPLDNPVPAGGVEPRHPLSAEKPTIKILLYTDTPNVFTLAFDMKFSLAPMVEHLMGHAPAFADLCIRWVSRYPAGSSQPVKKINDVLDEELCGTKKPFDQIWFFGFATVSRAKFSLGLVPGGPDSDLDDKEVSALVNWMSAVKNMGGGVLMLGDHSEEIRRKRLDGSEEVRRKRPGGNKNKLCPDDKTCETFFGLGRALGRCVPRARRLRVWEGGPRRDVDNHDTVGMLPSLETDRRPQELMLKRFDEKGEPAQSGWPHPLFFYRQGSWIEFFPDHGHEGAVVAPVIAPDDDEWPKGACVRPLPREVACGVNKRNLEIINLVVAYDGDVAEVGRVVAGSTWHHFVSMNLINLRHPAPTGSAADQIGQYYGNLAVWLSPRATRREMASAMFWWLASHARMLEEVGGDALDIGRTAYSLLLREALPCEIHELLLAAAPDRVRGKYETLYFPEDSSVLSELPSKELILGCVIDAYHREMIKLEDADGPLKLLGITQLTDAGFETAFQRRWEQLARVESAARKLVKSTRKAKGDRHAG